MLSILTNVRNAFIAFISPLLSHNNNFHGFSYTEQGQKIVLFSCNLSKFDSISFVLVAFYSFLKISLAGNFIYGSSLYNTPLQIVYLKIFSCGIYRFHDTYL